MGEEIAAVRKFGLRVNSLVGILATFTLATMIGTPLQAGLLLTLIWICIILTLLISGLRMVKAENLKVYGKVTIQGTWFYMSLSLAYLIMTPAPYFQIPLFNVAIDTVIGIIILAIGTYSLIRTRRETGVMISI